LFVFFCFVLFVCFFVCLFLFCFFSWICVAHLFSLVLI
jgi:hypothetical protein